PFPAKSSSRPPPSRHRPARRRSASSPPGAVAAGPPLRVVRSRPVTPVRARSPNASKKLLHNPRSRNRLCHARPAYGRLPSCAGLPSRRARGSGIGAERADRPAAGLRRQAAQIVVIGEVVLHHARLKIEPSELLGGPTVTLQPV